jgi:hypothetical protein
MIVPLLALALAATPPDPVLHAGHAYTQCLDELMRKYPRERRAQARFEQEAIRQCAAQAGRLRSVLIADDLASGISRAQAEANAAREIAHMLDLAKAMFAASRGEADPHP